MRHVIAFVSLAAFLSLAPTMTFAQSATLSRAQLDSLRVLQPRTRALQVIAPSHTMPVAESAPSVTLQRGQFLRSEAPLMVTEVGGRKRYVLPVRFTGLDATGQHLLSVAPVLEVEQKALRLDETGTHYQASALVGLDDLLSPNVRRPLSETLQLSADRATIDPADVSIDVTGSPYQRVLLTSSAPGDSVLVTLRFRGEHVQAVVGVERPKIRVTGIPDGLAGLGVGTATVTVSLSEDAGSAERDVALSLNPGSVSPTQVKINALESKSVTLRTSTLKGKARFQATNNSLTAYNQDVDLVFPGGFLAASLLGGILGSLMVWFSQSKDARKQLGAHLVTGGISGLIAAGAYVLGLNITELAIPIMFNELAIFVIAAVAAAGGSQLLKKLSSGGAAPVVPQPGH